MKNLIWFVLLLVGCSESATELTAWQKAMRDGSIETVAATKTVESKTDEAIGILKDNTTALAAIKAKVDALQVVSNPNGKDGDPESAPESPAKANDTQNPLKVATPGTSSRTASDGTVLRWNIEGNWNPTILETSAHLREHGINTNGMTHQEMADIHASIHDGKQIPVSAVRVKNAGAVSNCPGGMCPTNRTQRRRGLFGGLFR
jgi:hypothetical protein